MNKQEIYDRVKKHLLTQNVRSTEWQGSSPECKYRGDNGTKCAIGALIPDRLYSTDMEGSSVSGLSERYACTFDKIFGNTLAHDDLLMLLRDLQVTHDNFYPKDWKAELTYVANKHGLNP